MSIWMRSNFQWLRVGEVFMHRMLLMLTYSTIQISRVGLVSSWAHLLKWETMEWRKTFTIQISTRANTSVETLVLTTINHNHLHPKPFSRTILKTRTITLWLERKDGHPSKRKIITTTCMSALIARIQIQNACQVSLKLLTPLICSNLRMM